MTCLFNYSFTKLKCFNKIMVGERGIFYLLSESLVLISPYNY